MKLVRWILPGFALALGVFLFGATPVSAEEAPDGAFAELPADSAQVQPAETPPPEAQPVVEAATPLAEVPQALAAVAQPTAPPPTEQPVAVEAPPTEDALPAEAALAPQELAAEGDGERYENGNWVYYENGQKHTGWKQLADGRLVYYNADGNIQLGERQMEDGKWYYFSQSDGRWMGGMLNFDGRDLYYDWENGMYFGERQIGDAWHYFNLDNGARMLGEVNLYDIPGEWSYYTEAGRYTGELNYDGRWLHYNPYDGRMSYGTTLLQDGRTVFYSYDNGAMQFGEFYRDAKVWGRNDELQDVRDWYYADPGNGQLAQGLTQLPDGRLVHYGQNGMTFGQFWVGNTCYYASMANGQLDFKGGWIKQPDGSTVYFVGGSWGLASGPWEVDGKTYYFSDDYTSDAYGTMQTGWQKGWGDQWMYFGVDGVFTGRTNITDPGDDALFAAQLNRYIAETRRNENLPPLVENANLSAYLTQAMKELALTTNSATRPDGRAWDTLLAEYGLTGIGNTPVFGAEYYPINNTQDFSSVQPGIDPYVTDEAYRDFGYGFYRDKDGNRFYAFLFTDLSLYKKP